MPDLGFLVELTGQFANHRPSPAVLVLVDIAALCAT
jgi:hypothetical protein